MAKNPRPSLPLAADEDQARKRQQGKNAWFRNRSGAGFHVDRLRSTAFLDHLNGDMNDLARLMTSVLRIGNCTHLTRGNGLFRIAIDQCRDSRSHEQHSKDQGLDVQHAEQDITTFVSF